MDWFCECEGQEVPETQRGYDARYGPIHLASPPHTLRCETTSVLRTDFNVEDAQEAYRALEGGEVVG
jgi:hypothetical protein